MKCLLCGGSGENRSGIRMITNNHICPRCGGYGTVPDGTKNNSCRLTSEDREYAARNGRIA